MKVVIQNVLEAKLNIDDKIYSSIFKGYYILVSFTHSDDRNIVDLMAKKIIDLRLFCDTNGKTNLSILDVKGSILSVSQFTLYADVKNGRRPSFLNSLTPSKAIELYEYFNNKLQSYGVNVKTGVFGADMKISTLNDGPFTVILDSMELWNK